MEQNVPVLAKKVWSLVRVVLFVLRKSNISKKRLLMEFNMMIKRGKIVRKALQHLMFHHHNNSTNHHSPPGEYEFSCGNSPSTNNHKFSLFSFHKKAHHNNSSNQHGEDVDINVAVMKAMEMIHSETASPALPGFGRSPMVRQLRVTDSPFPLSSVDEDCHVDEAAEEFISRFYNDLRRQN
ncbi:hypothetical protein HanHA300_Chr16g0592821 [Helianthus annuus]|nr:hypothetical protein HanHA300_Chr16g0592821 [Helianthus annuus]